MGLKTESEMIHQITTQLKEKRLLFNLTTQPCLSSSAMTHISLSVSRRGGVQNDALAWKISLKPHVEGSNRAVRLGKKQLILSFCHCIYQSLFVSTVGSVTVGSISFLSPSGSTSLLTGPFVQLSVYMSQSILRSVLSP